jgi:hypothetical protein
MAVSSANADTRNILPTIKVPTLLIWGEKDKRAPISVAHQMHAAIQVQSLRLLRRRVMFAILRHLINSIKSLKSSVCPFQINNHGVTPRLFSQKSISRETIDSHGKITIFNILEFYFIQMCLSPM